ncbi:MAG: glycosyltransferase family 4 protein [Anaerolineae bacterium]
MAGKSRLRVAINAQLIPDGSAGGIQQAVLGLIHTLGQLEDNDIEYVIIAHAWAPQWLRPYLGENQRLVRHPIRGPIARVLGIGKRAMWPLRPRLLPVWRLLRRRDQASFGEPRGPVSSDGFIESLGVDVVHFPYQSMTLSAVPTIFNPWDLQHLHYPEFFPPSTFARREATYPLYCRHAAAIVMASRCMGQDLIERYKIDPQKVYVIPLAASTRIPVPPASLERVRRVYRLPEVFTFYPAQTWPHKNHVRLLEALSLLRNRCGPTVQLVCTGGLNEFWPVISQRIRELRLENQARFLGFVSQAELGALYRLAQFVVIPSLFEGWGFPLIEAFQEGAPVASSWTTSLGEYAGDAALLFDPTSVESIANAVGRMATDERLRTELVQRGQERVKAFSWEPAAKMYRALYRKVGGGRLTEEEERLLSCERVANCGA